MTEKIPEKRPAQVELDSWFGVTPGERASLRGGNLPTRFLPSASSAAVSRALFVVSAAGAGAGALMLLRVALGARLPGSPAEAALLGAILAALVALFATRRVAEQGPTLPVVQSEVLELRFAPATGRVGSRLEANDGRTFQAVLLTLGLPGVPGGTDLAGRYRIYYLEFAKAGRAAKSDPLALALESID